MRKLICIFKLDACFCHSLCGRGYNLCGIFFLFPFIFHLNIHFGKGLLSESENRWLEQCIRLVQHSADMFGQHLESIRYIHQLYRTSRIEYTMDSIESNQSSLPCMNCVDYMSRIRFISLCCR